MAGSKDGGERHDKQSHYRHAAMLHPLRQRIAGLLSAGAEHSAAAIAGEVDAALGRVAYHLRVLVRHDVLEVIPKRPPASPLYGWSPRAGWARKMLAGEGEEGS
jgi:Helix-turn-helix domain